MATLQFRRGTAFIDPQVGEPFLDTNINGLKIGIGGSDFITLLSSSSLDTSISGFDNRLDNIELTTSSLNTSVSNLNSFTQSFNTAISLDTSNVTILGDLDVQGTTTTIDSTTITLGDNIIELNGTGASNGGILVNDVTNPSTLSGSLLWDGTNDYWKAGQLGSENEIITTANIVSNLPTNTISGSSQIDHDQTTNYSAAEHFLQSEITTVGTVTVGSVTSILPSGTVSGSSQIDHDQTTNYSAAEHFLQSEITTVGTVTNGSVTAILPSGTVSGSSQIDITGGLPSGTVSGSSQIDHDQTTNYSAAEHFLQSEITTVGTVTNGSVTSILPSGTVSGSSQIDITGGLPSGTVSGSIQVDVTQTTNYSSINQYTDSDFDTRFGTKSTTDLSEGTNKYYTDSKVKTKLDVEGVISGSSQVDVTQTTNYSSINQYTDSDTQDYLDSIGVVSGSVSSQLPSGTVSGSEQIDHDLTLNFSPAEHYTQENITTVGTVTTGNVDGILPSGTVSGSSQVDVTQTTNYSSINQYTDSDTQDYLDSIGVVSGSISGQLPSGTVSGSEQIDHDLTLNFSPAEHYTQENITTVGTVTTGNIDSILPTGTVSGSSQIDVTQTTNYSSINQYTDSDFDTRFGTKSTTDLSEGTNKYYTDTKVKTKLDAEGVISGSSQIDHDQTTNYSANEHFTQENITTVGTVTNGSVTAILPSGTVSGSSQIDITGGIPTGTVSGSSQIDHDQTTNFVTNEHIDHSSVSIIAGSGLTGGGNITISRTLNVGAGDGINVNVDDIEVDSTVARTNQDNNFSSLQTFNDITVNGTGSFAYIEQVTGSAKIIGDAFLILNNDTPAERYAGIKVLDSGSVTPTTASLQYDGQTNDWFLEYEDNGTSEHGIMMFGPEYSTIGAPTYLTNNTIPKADGGHHFNDSNITDNGSTITLDSTLYVTQSRVGIGTTSPDGTLHLDAGTSSDLVIEKDDAGYASVRFHNGGSQVSYIQLDASEDMIHYGGSGVNQIIYAGGSERMRIDSSGNTTFSGTIDVNTASSGLPTIKLSHTNTGADNFEIKAGISGVSNSGFSIRDVDASANRFIIDTSGNVGIGQSNPGAPLHISHDSGDTVILTKSTTEPSFRFEGDTDKDFVLTISGETFTITQNDGTTDILALDHDTKNAIFAGNVGIGTTTTPAAKLDIKESSNAAGDAVIRLRGHGLDADNTVLGALEFFNADSSGDQPGVVARVEAQSGNANGHMGELVFKTHDGSEGGEGSSPKENMRLDATGNLFVSGTIFAQGDVVAFATSDKRLKDNLTQIVTPLSKLSQINGYTFDWNNEKQHIYKGKDYGVVAQEIQEVLPELVKERENGYLAVNYEKMVPLLIESIKELKTQVEYLNKKLENK